MVDQQFILSTEELSFSLSYCGYDGLAAGMLKEAIGEVSEEGLELVFQTAARSLFTKGILLNLNEENSETSFVEGFRELLDDMANSETLLRCFNENEHGQFILTAHQGRNGYVFHLVSNEIVHVLNYISKDGLKSEMLTFFGPPLIKDDAAAHSFTCTEEQFQTLIEGLQGSSPTAIHGLNQGDPSLVEFIRDYQSTGGNLVNMAVLKTEEESLPEFLEVYILLLSKERTWAIRNLNADKDKEPFLIIQTLPESGWDTLVARLIDLI